MGESIVEVPIVESKMGESVSSGATLEPSVSFGRFARDLLTWEKWSSFSPNKYVEEVEKCSKPGSVAEKKAYFEAHYRKIVAQKAVQSEKDKPVQSASPRSDELKHGSHIGNTFEYNCEFGVSNGGRSNPEMEHIAQKKAYLEAHFRKIAARKAEQLELDKPLTSSDELKHDNYSEKTSEIDCDFGVHNDEKSIKQVEHEVAVDRVANSTTIDDFGEKEVVSGAECLSTLIKDVKQELGRSQPVYTECSDGGRAALVEEHKCQESSPEVLKQDLKVDNHANKSPKNLLKNMKIKGRNITSKKTPAKKDQMLTGMKKKVVSPAAKPSPLSAPRLSKPAPSSPLMSATKVSGENLSRTFFPINKNTTLVRENRKAGPTSLHVSLSLGPSNPSVEHTSSRKSLIMEQMAEKDIIKRVFKAFQNNYGELRSSYIDNFDGANQVSSKALGQEVTTLTPRKENEGMRKAADKNTPSRGSSETKSFDSRLDSSKEKRNTKALSSSVGLKSDASAGKREQFLKKSGRKKITRQVEKAQLDEKLKGKDVKMKMLKQNSRTPVHTYTEGVSSNHSQKIGVKKSGLAR